VVYDAPPSFAFGRADSLRDGEDVTIIAAGLMVAAALVAHDRLTEMGVAARVVNMASLRPLDEDVVATAARETGAIVTVEEAWIDDGLGAAVARVVMECHPVPMEHLGLEGTGPDAYAGDAGDQLAHGLTAAHVMGAVHDVLERKASPR
jgi:transketolase